MNTRLNQWLASPKATLHFHPSWVLMGVGASLAIALLLWLFSEAVLRHQRPVPAVPLLPTSTQHLPASEQPPSDTVIEPALPAPKIIRTGFTPSDADGVPDNEFSGAFRLGRVILTDTQTCAKAYVGNGVNCPLDTGRKADSGPLWAAYRP